MMFLGSSAISRNFVSKYHKIFYGVLVYAEGKYN